ncbi:C-C motif chemokine 20a.3 precursor [Danio rerio]|uniref:C-C motif chemokine n=1 Tax=Danio rerio TaxID=7955 RepID=B3DGM0_DANRE|nr:C-C motif chemokine 20a.3 precursor [Danio rerio]XP_056323878.1 C-C motif chemokine 20a.3 [Danio aesculapii]AAI62444.1 Similar to small inducible cytokine A4 [Danio rerio]AAI62445.1 Similar to small inducible cytokine A4 [Danio rerio]CAX14304.1 novel protein [Danio rerio]|eukprot:NP_001129726.1 chemokine (C-C motif) ligand 20-like precursor [Danio rerio]
MSRISACVMVLTIVALGLLCTDAAAVSCCRKYTKGMIPMSLIKGYSIQTITRSCHINAVIFHTNGGKNICTDPSKGWVMESIRKLREKVQAINKKNSKA